MASSYTSRLKIEKIGIGEQANSWGNTTNNTFDTTIDEAISGVLEINLASPAPNPYILSNDDGPVARTGTGTISGGNQFRNAAFRFYGHTTAHTVQFVTGKERIAYVVNGAAADSDGVLTLRSGDGTGGSSGNTITIAPGNTKFVATNGTDWYPLEAGASANWRTVSTATDNVYKNQNILVDTNTNPVTLTLPTHGSSAVGDTIGFLDLRGTFASNALTIDPQAGGIVFGGTAGTTGTVNTNDAAFKLVFCGSSYGWKLTEK